MMISKKIKVKLDSLEKLQEFSNICIRNDNLHIKAMNGKFEIDTHSLIGLMLLDLQKPITIMATLYNETEHNIEEEWIIFREFENDIAKFMVEEE